MMRLQRATATRWAVARLVVAGVAVVAGGGMPLIARAATTCMPAGSTGLTAALVATSGERISGTVAATGCDVGIFIGPGDHDVTVKDAHVSGANDHGIFVQDADHVTIKDDTISGNGVAPHSIAEDKAIDLVGTSYSAVVDNVVTGNLADGGIAINDDGPFDPGALPGHPGALRPAVGDVVVGNQVSGNLIGCGIVLSSYNPGAGVAHDLVARNVVSGSPGQFPPVLGAIVLAGQSVIDNTVVGNIVTGSFIPGIVVHSNTPAEKVSGTVILHNTLIGDDWGRADGPPAMVGIILAAGSTPPGELVDTLVSANRIRDEDYGIYLQNTTDTRIVADRHNQATIPVGP